MEHRVLITEDDLDLVEEALIEANAKEAYQAYRRLKLTFTYLNAMIQEAGTWLTYPEIKYHSDDYADFLVRIKSYNNWGNIENRT
jgi:hypothetical protein